MSKKNFPLIPSDTSLSAKAVNDAKELDITIGLVEAKVLHRALNKLIAENPRSKGVFNIFALVEAFNNTMKRNITLGKSTECRKIHIQLPLLIAACVVFQIYRLKHTCMAADSVSPLLPKMLEEALFDHSREAARNIKQWLLMGLDFSDSYNALFVLLSANEYQTDEQANRRRRSKLLSGYLTQIQENSREYQLSLPTLGYMNIEKFNSEFLKTLSAEGAKDGSAMFMNDVLFAFKSQQCELIA